ncbi:hypothetical protein [Blastococcus sp. TF02A-30]|uniref:hypothetical protein n=1 Tax=Blastococcus sp. TF02A-30 TaxID=2250580 RepID=UPI000DEA2FCD|nr:hypothetical protein [Blastococcus sp. TF02A-30]RBY86489.1 hypothetical protein DQ241_13260 [Blastococcus sp. TF02A-30]
MNRWWWAYGAYAVGSVVFLLSALRQGSALLAVGSTLFLVGTMLFVVPDAARRLREDPGEPGGTGRGG